jgi:hypothetical protein
MLHAVGWTWARKDPQAMLASIGQIKDRHMVVSLAKSALEELARRDPQQALLAAESLDSAASPAGLAIVMAQWAKIDAEAATAAILQRPASRERTGMLHSVAQSYALTDPDQAMLWLEQFPADEQDDLRAAMVASIANNDPDQAVAMAMNHAGPQRGEMLAQALRALAQSDPFRAGSLLSELPADGSRFSAARAVAREAAARDVFGALTWMASLDSVAFAGAARPVSEALVESNPQAAKDFASRLSGQQRAAWVRAVADNLARRDPDSALAFVEAQADTSSYTAIFNDVLPRIAETEPQRALALTERVPERHRRDVVMSVLGRMAEQQPHAAAQWIGRQPAGEERDALAAAVLQFGAFSPDDASAMIGAMQSAESRERAVAITYLSLLRRSGNSRDASAFLNQLDLTPQQRESIESLAHSGGY